MYRGITASTGRHQSLTLVYTQRTCLPLSEERSQRARRSIKGYPDETLMRGKGRVPHEDRKRDGERVRAYWLEGTPHQFFYRDSAGNPSPETLRLAGNTLLWEQGAVTFRLEAQVSRDDALRIATSFR